MSHLTKRKQEMRRQESAAKARKVLAESGVPTIRAKGIVSAPPPKHGCAFWNWGNRGATHAKPRRRRVMGTFAHRTLHSLTGMTVNAMAFRRY